MLRIGSTCPALPFIARTSLFWAGYVPASTLPELLEGQPEFVQQTRKKSILRLCEVNFSPRTMQFIPLCDDSVDDLGKRGTPHFLR